MTPETKIKRLEAKIRDKEAKLKDAKDEIRKIKKECDSKIKVAEREANAARRSAEKARRSPPKGSELHYQGKIATIQSELRGMRRDLKRAQYEHGMFRALVEEMETMIAPIEPPEKWTDNRSKRGTIEEHLVMHLSDEHADEIVEPHKVGGLEKYDFNIALCRAEQYIDTTLKWTTSTLAKHRFPVLHVLAYGDHTSGEIHGAVTRSHFRNMFRNSLAIGQMHALMLRDLSAHFKKVCVYYVPGNHGRRSRKKDFHGAWDNWDYLIAEIARLTCSDIKNIQFAIPDSFSMNIDINGWGFGIEHGDGVKSWMGIPWYGLERKTRRLVSLHNSTGKQIQYFVFGHFHSMSTNADLRGEMIINGAWPATNPYSYEEFSGYREPMQLIHGVHPEKGISWRLPVKLKDAKREQSGATRYIIDLADHAFVEEMSQAGLDTTFPGGGPKIA